MLTRGEGGWAAGATETEGWRAAEAIGAEGVRAAGPTEAKGCRAAGATEAEALKKLMLMFLQGREAGPDLRSFLLFVFLESPRL